MRRDFSETAEQSLKDLIDQINDEQWSEWTDYIGDFFILGLDIQNYLDDVDTYHKKILDKKDTEKDTISDIFKAVRAVDAAYQSIFQTCCDHVKEQREYIEQLVSCIDTGSSFVSFEKMEEQMSSASKDLSHSKVLFYMDKFRNSEGNNEYDYNYLREIMNTDPNEIPLELYAALVYTFNEMNLSDKEKFIECAYIRTEEVHPDLDNSNGRPVKRKHEVSAGLFILSEFYKQELHAKPYDPINDEKKQWIGNYSLLRAVCEQGNSIYLEGYKSSVDLTLENGQYNNDYCLTFNGSSTPYNEWWSINNHKHTIDVYGVKDRITINKIFQDHAVELSESLRVDVGKEIGKTVFNAFVGRVVDDSISAVVGSSPEIDWAMTFADTYIECVGIAIEGQITNSTIDRFQTLLLDAGTYQALHMNASFSISDGEYNLYYTGLDHKELYWSLETYKDIKNKELKFEVLDVLLKFEGEGKDELPGLKDYIDWYLNENGESETKKFKEEQWEKDKGNSE